jgi:hypothetical protein
MLKDASAYFGRVFREHFATRAPIRVEIRASYNFFQNYPDLFRQDKITVEELQDWQKQSRPARAWYRVVLGRPIVY